VIAKNTSNLCHDAGSSLLAQIAWRFGVEVTWICLLYSALKAGMDHFKGFASDMYLDSQR
jgi:hypothetical protein